MILFSYFLQVPPEQKLPVLYLLDSIMKNLGGEYLQLFSRNIVATFCHTFEKLVGSFFKGCDQKCT